MAETSPLRRRMIDDRMVRNLAPTTLQSDIYAVAKFSRYFNRSPDRLGWEEVRAYQLHLIARQRSWSHINQTACALRFFYGVSWAVQRRLTALSPHASRRSCLWYSVPRRSCGSSRRFLACATEQH
jgi:hypothetical protein